MYGVDGRDLSRQYKHHISNYHSWEQLSHADDYVLFKHNLGEHISMDETCLSQGERYTIITNKSAHGGKGSLIAMIRDTKSQGLLYYLNKPPRSLHVKINEITIDLSPAMKIIARGAFSNATIVSGRFHVQKLMNEAISDLRVDYRWQAIDMENAEMELARGKFTPHLFDNGDTYRQLLARSRHIVMKYFSKWTPSQARRAEILFEQYTAIKEAYEISMDLTQIYNERITDKPIALTKLARWYESV